MTKYSAYDLAKWLVNKANEQEVELTQMKLQKLLYYAQGYWMALNEGHSLFPEDFRAFQYGPVCTEILDAFPDQGARHINKSDCLYMGTRLDGEELRHMNKIWKSFSHLTPVQLSRMTHNETPWKSTHRNQIIDKREIYSYFSGLLQNNKARREPVNNQS